MAEAILLGPLQTAGGEDVAPELHLLGERFAPIEYRRPAHPKLAAGDRGETT
jgi:hypothetical protein